MEQENKDVSITTDVNPHLLKAGRWAKYVSILGFIYIAMTSVYSILGQFYFLSATFTSLEPLGIGLLLIQLLGHFGILAMIYPFYQLYKFADTLLNGRGTQDQAMVHLASFFKWLTIVIVISKLSSLLGIWGGIAGNLYI